VFSAVFFWPRNEIMFVDPVGTHSPEYLRQVAAEFVAGHWVRFAGGAVTAVLAFVALLKFVRSTASVPAPASASVPASAPASASGSGSAEVTR